MNSIDYASMLLSDRGRNATEQPISQLMSAALTNPNIISLAAGFVDSESLPTKIVSETAQRVLLDEQAGRVALQYGTTLGPNALRSEIARRNFAKNHQELADRMILTAGSNQLLHLCTDCLLDPGDIVLCAAPTYFVFLGLLQDIGVRAYGVESDDHGMTSEALDSSLRQLEQQGELHRVKAVYFIPYSDNPGGTTPPVHRRQEILEVFNRWNAKSPMVLLVDNAYRDLQYVSTDIPTLTDLGADPESTVETGTFSKNFSPGIRVGWGTVPPWLGTPMARTKSVVDFGSAHMNQQLMLHVLRSGEFDQQVQRLRAVYARKLAAMLDACRENLVSIPGLHFREPTGGLYVWMQLPPGVDAGPQSALWEQCVERGVLYVPGEFCFPSEGAKIQNNSMRLSFGVQSESQIHRGIEILAEAIKTVARTPAATLH